ncbi:MAG: 50S ribosomal protein L4 [Dehalococcoidales bacterium]|nr:50S ribosomal protein L4 [Dehalococcoidales bacterium]
MQVPVYNLNGEAIKNIEINDTVFNVPFNEALVHQVFVAQRANARQGTADTKTRSEVAGSTKKLYRQKGTGNARAGNSRSPLRRHGGVTFGPHPRNYRQDTPKKMRQSAIRCLLSVKVRDGELKILENLELTEPKTKEMARILQTLGIENSALIVDGKPAENMVKSARNLPATKTLPAGLLNVGDLLSYKVLVMTENAVRQAESLWSKTPVEEV